MVALPAEPGLGWEPRTFLEAYWANRRDGMEATFEADAKDLIRQRNRTNEFEIVAPYQALAGIMEKSKAIAFCRTCAVSSCKADR